MAGRVGSKGNIVIDKGIRERLGVEPGWETIQVLRDGYVEVHFLPPMHAGNSAGIVQIHGTAPWLLDDDALHAAIDRAAEEELRARTTAQPLEDLP